MECERRDMDVYRQGKVITDQFYVDDDYNVPDAKNDVGSVIIGEGNLLVEDMKVVENYIRVSPPPACTRPYLFSHIPY